MPADRAVDEEPHLPVVSLPPGIVRVAPNLIAPEIPAAEAPGPSGVTVVPDPFGDGGKREIGDHGDPSKRSAATFRSRTASVILLWKSSGLPKSP